MHSALTFVSAYPIPTQFVNYEPTLLGVSECLNVIKYLHADTRLAMLTIPSK